MKIMKVTNHAIAKSGHSINISVWEKRFPLGATNVFHLDQLDCVRARDFVM